MPIRCTQCDDKLIWTPDRFGDYTVKSAYYLIKGTDEQADIPTSCSPDISVWSKIWSAGVNPRIKLHAWTICNRNLPANYNLAHRIESLDNQCPCCVGEVETDVHALRDCMHSRQVWDLLNVDIDYGSMKGIDWLHGMADKLSKDDFSIFHIGVWALWNRRNAFVFEGVFKSESVVVEEICALHRELSRGSKDKTEGVSKKQLCKWIPPSLNFVKMNVDATVIDNVGTGLGMVIRDPRGTVIVATADQMSIEMSPVMAEACAIFKGLQLALAHGFREIEVESDCQTLILVLQKTNRCPFNVAPC